MGKVGARTIFSQLLFDILFRLGSMDPRGLFNRFYIGPKIKINSRVHIEIHGQPYFCQDINLNKINIKRRERRRNWRRDDQTMLGETGRVSEKIKKFKKYSRSASTTSRSLKFPINNQISD